MAGSLVDGFMSSFGNTIKSDAESHMKIQLEAYKQRFNKIQSNNTQLLKETYDNYTQKQEKSTKRMTNMVDKKVAESNRRLRNELAMINDDLFNDPKELHKKIKKATQALEKIEKDFAKEKKAWINDDKRIAKWLGRPWILANDDVKETLDDAKQFASDLEFVTIKVDDRTFRTYRKTLTQVKGSKIAKLFTGECVDKQLMKYYKETGVYSLNCNPNTFGQVLEILRTKGAVHIEMTSALYAALLEFGILKKFYPSLSADTSMSGVTQHSTQVKGFHVVFEAYRSTANNSYYPKWNKKILCSTEQKGDEMEYWQLNSNDDSEIMFLQTGYYRVTFRCCQNYSSHAYAQMYIDGSGYDFSRRYAATANNIRSYHFNEVRQFTEGQKLRFYVHPACAYAEEKSTYLCIEKIPDKILPGIGIWKSSSSSANYRQWNSAIKGSDRYKLQSDNKQIAMNKGGLYRVSVRVHSNYSAAGIQQMYLYENRNGSNQTHISYQSTSSTNYQCHMFDEILISKQNDYVHLYDGGYLTASNYNYDCIQIQYIPFNDVIGVWKSGTVISTYQRVWDHEYWTNDMLYSLNNTKNVIEVKKNGNYRVSCNTTQYQGSNLQGYSALYINETEYCKSRMGCYGGTYYHTTSIQEIVDLKKGDKVYIYSSHPYNSKDFNSLFIEKLM